MIFINNRILWIDRTKGFAIILVVLGHIIRGFLSSNVFTNYIAIFTVIDYLIYSFHMPLFFIISGYLYYVNFNIYNKKQYFEFVKKKFKNIMVPYFIFSWFQILIKIFLSSQVNNSVDWIDFFKIVISPVEQFWFLYALMIIFIIISYVDWKIKSNNIKLLIIIFIFSMIKTYNIEFGIISVALLNLIYFYIGRYLIYLLQFLDKKDAAIILSLLPLVYFILCYLSYYNVFTNNIIECIIALILALIGSLLMITFAIKTTIKSVNLGLIDIIGKYSMSIYLLHIIFASGVRIILLKLNIFSFLIHFILAINIGIFLPILLSSFYHKNLLIKKSNFNNNFLKKYS